MNGSKSSLRNMIIAAVLLCAGGAQAATVVRYVSLTGSGADGKTWSTAYKTIQAALNDAAVVTGSEIHVKAGVYSVTVAIDVRKAVKIYGGYSGVNDTRNWTAYQTTVDGGTKAGHCFNVKANATIDGFAILNGSSVGQESNGGGVNITSCAPTISNCLFKYNKSAGFGGGLATLMGTGAKVTGCTFNQNTASECGGAIYNEMTTSMEISNCTFTQNSANDSGGAIHNYKSNVTITGCLIQANKAALTTLGVGGGILNEESAPTISNCTFMSNRAPYGVGVYNYMGSPTIDSCWFANCDAAALTGGGVYSNSGTPTIKSCLFQANAVKDQGGALFTESAGGRVINCVFLSNSAAYGGGAIYVGKGSNTTVNPQFINCTIYGNSTPWRGGAVYNEATPATFINCIIWGNSAADANPGIYADAGWSSNQPAARYCDIQGDSTYPGIGNARSDPHLGDPSHMDFGIAFDSPCLDTGNNAAIIGTLKDYEDNTRVVDGDGNGTANVDMGAVELQGQPDHLKHGEIMQCVTYDSSSDATPTYTFMLRLEADDGVSSVSFQAPGGSTTYTIPDSAQNTSGNVTTYHRTQGTTHVWEYWATTGSLSGLSVYGNGIYRLTVRYRNNTQAQLQVVYLVPGSAGTIPMPNQKPQMTAPGYDARTRSPVTFRWSICNDPSVNSVRLTITDASSDEEVIGDVLSRKTTQSREYTLAEGSYEAELGFANLYQVTCSDGTPFEFGKAVLVGHRFTVPYTAVYRFHSPSSKTYFYTSSPTERDYLLQNSADVWSYDKIVFNVCTKQSNTNLKPVYRFSSGRSYFYTLDDTERSQFVANASVWKAEGVAFYAYPDGSEPADGKAVFRFYNSTDKVYFYTMDEAEANALFEQVPAVFAYQGVAFYAYAP